MNIKDDYEFWKYIAVKMYRDMGYEQYDTILSEDTKVSELPISSRLMNLLIKRGITTVKHITELNNLCIKGMGMVLSKEYGILKYQYKLTEIYK